MFNAILNPIATKVYQCWPSGYYTVKTGILKEWKDRFLEVKGFKVDVMDYSLKQNPQWYRNIKTPTISIDDIDTYIPPPIPTENKSQLVVTFGDNAWPLSTEPELPNLEKINQFQSWYEQATQRAVYLAGKAEQDQDVRRSVFMLISAVTVGAAVILGFMVLSQWFL